LEIEVSELTFQVPEDPYELRPVQLRETVDSLRDQGNACVKKGFFQRAICWYNKGLEVLDKSRWSHKVNEGSELHTHFRTVNIAILTNLALSFLQEKSPDPRKAVECCDRVLQMEPFHIKAVPLRHYSGKLPIIPA